MCHQNSCVHFSAEEAVAAEESLLIYCKPVELYNILQCRALQNPSFLQRCLRYKIQARRKQRLQMTISLSGAIKDGMQAKDLLPVYVLMAKPVSDTEVAAGKQHSEVYRLNRACKLSSFTEFEGWRRAEANFILPEMNKLSLDVKAGKLTILLVSCGEARNSFCEANVGGYCLWGKLPMESLYSSLEKSASLTLGNRAEMLSNVDMQSCFLEPCFLEEGSCTTFHTPHDLGTMGSQKVQVNIVAQKVGAKEKSPYASYTYRNIPTSSLSNIIRLRAGNVIFNYRDRSDMPQKIEVTENFSCPFCLMQCASFKGLRYHLCSSHDLFNFDFWVTEEYQAVNVSVKVDILRSEIMADGVDPRLQTFFCSKPHKRRRLKNQVQNANHVFLHFLESGSPNFFSEAHKGFLEKDDDALSCEGEKSSMSLPCQKDLQNARPVAESYAIGKPSAVECIERVASNLNETGVPIAMAQSSVDMECVQSISGSPTPPAVLQFPKTRKLSFERSEPRNRTLLQKRQFFHSHRAQPMALDQVLSDRDSEDEVDDDIADFEDRRMLDDFVDVTKDEKQFMHLWNSFVRKQRVLADGHIPWACEAFSKLHGQELVQAPAIFWCWRLFMIKLWNHGLLDARTMNSCNLVLEGYRNEVSDTMKS
ncbi:polycomb group protein EMBRYONIC FLOWER 2 isoform X2 [Vitis vinifera]|uniref:polycomb group protein EMBRYONIC FLOWER 2 isoform X2 n=1 Tax=Vitis vinifera TaxID=29760 RepID=UPI0028831B5D|nr:polycomb group protein EMBRYONIC FLOWER 2 isoform X2 [Vitis vinifera]